MKRNAFALVVLVVVGLVSTVSLTARARHPGAGSVQSRGVSGWAAARFYLEERGTPVTLIDRPLADVVGEPGVLVLALPWQRWELSEVRPELTRHLQGGRDIVFAYSGERPHPMGEGKVAEALGLRQTGLRPRAPLGPFAWSEFVREEWELHAPGGTSALKVRAFAHGFEPPAGATILLADARGRALAFAFPRLGGRVVVLPAALLANASLGSAGSADLLESLRAGLPGTWAFDEYHHGLVSAATPAAASGRRVFDLWLLHLAVVYVLALAALARPFGPVWQDPPVRTGSAATFLRGLGALHKRLGHEREAAVLLVARARELDPRLPARDPGSGSLLALAQSLADERAHRRTR